MTLAPGTPTTSLTGLGATATALPFWPNSYLVQFASHRDVAAFPTAVKAAWGVAWFYPLIPHRLTPRMTNDPRASAEWHLKNTGQGGGTVGADAHVEPVWNAGITGAGVRIAVVDDGLLHAHQDLTANYDGPDSYDFNDNDPDPTPLPFDTHGTSVAGVAAARGDNGIGVVGAAYDASVAGIRLIAGFVDDVTEAAALSYHADAIDIYSNSWGPADNGIQDGPGPAVLAEFENNFAAGRGGKGSIYTWAAGNGLQAGDNVNYDGYANNRHVIAVGAVTNTAAQAWYSEPGAPMLVTAYSNGGTRGITTTDGPGTADYTDSFGGTSSAAPLVAGVVALMLDANPALTSRDVQAILVHSADKVDPTDPGWSTNGAGLHFNHKYGFGGIDAAAAVALAKTWTPLKPEVTAATGFLPVNAPLPNGTGAGVTARTTLTAGIRIEHVEVVFSATHPNRGDLRVVLTSPSGTKSVLAATHYDPGDDYSAWTFSSVRDWDESAAGTWTLRVTDGAGNADAGKFTGWQLRVYGTAAPVAPALGGVSPTALRYLENQPAAVFPALTVTDVDSPTLAGASVAITGGFNPAEDRLLFADQNGISGAFAGSTLTLTGSASVADYQAALRSVRYDDLSENPAAAARTVTATVQDPDGLTSPAVTREVTVFAVNDAPSFTAGPDVVILQDSGPQVDDPWATDIVPGPPAEAGQAVALEIVADSNPRLFSAGPALTATGALSFTAAPGANGVATLQVRARDGGGTANGGVDVSLVQTVTITFTPRPTVRPDRYTTTEDRTLVVGVPGVIENDLSPYGTMLTAAVVDPPAHGALDFHPDGSFTYTPVASYHGADGFTYKLDDGTLDSVAGPVTIRVLPVNDPPIAAADSGATAGQPLYLPVLANDTDPDGDPLTVMTFTTPGHGRLTRSGSGLLYTPTPGYQGADGFSYTVGDGHGGTDTGFVGLTVTDAVPPTVSAVRVRYGAGGGKALDLAGLSRGALPWDSVSRIEIAFSEPVAVAGSALTLAGPAGPVALSFESSSDGRTAIWTVPAAGLTAGRYTLRLSAVGVTDLSPAANPLARDYARIFGILPGDFDGNGVVTARDVAGVRKKFRSTNAFADLTGDGIIDQADLEFATARLNSRI